MAKPKIFVSSTFFDLKQVRSDLDRFIREMGYESVLNELGHIAYGKDERLEEYCYKEIGNVDILLSIIGGRYGTESLNATYSISQMEFRKAIDLNKQVYIFIDRNVYSEYKTYLLNKEFPDIKYQFVDNNKVYEFIEFVEALPNNNAISTFEIASDIFNYLKEQLGGLFQRLLQEQTRVKEISLIKGVEATAKTLDQLVTFLTLERKDKDLAIRDILLSNHPAMEQLRSLLRVTYRVYFTNIIELDDWLSARSFQKDSFDFIFGDDFYVYQKVDNKTKESYDLTIKKDIFNQDGKLKVFTKDDWDNGNIVLNKNGSGKSNDDELPF